MVSSFMAGGVISSVSSMVVMSNKTVDEALMLSWPSSLSLSLLSRNVRQADRQIFAVQLRHRKQADLKQMNKTATILRKRIANIMVIAIAMYMARRSLIGMLTVGATSVAFCVTGTG